MKSQLMLGFLMSVCFVAPALAYISDIDGQTIPSGNLTSAPATTTETVANEAVPANTNRDVASAENTDAAATPTTGSKANHINRHEMKN